MAALGHDTVTHVSNLGANMALSYELVRSIAIYTEALSAHHDIAGLWPAFMFFPSLPQQAGLGPL